MPMLTQDDLKRIREVVRSEVESSEFTEKDLKAIGSIVEEKIDGLEERMNVKFDAVHEDIESIRNQMVTKDYLDRKLVEYVRKPY